MSLNSSSSSSFSPSNQSVAKEEKDKEEKVKEEKIKEKDIDLQDKQDIVYGCCAGGSVNVSENAVKEMDDFITRRSDGTYLFRVRDESSSSFPWKSTLASSCLEKGRFIVESFQCGKCKQVVRVLMCRDSAHSPNPLFPYFWYHVYKRGEFDSYFMKHLNYLKPQKRDQVKNRLNDKSLLVILKGCIFGELVILEPSPEIEVGMDLCLSCESTLDMIHVWSH